MGWTGAVSSQWVGSFWVVSSHGFGLLFAGLGHSLESVVCSLQCLVAVYRVRTAVGQWIWNGYEGLLSSHPKTGEMMLQVENVGIRSVLASLKHKRAGNAESGAVGTLESVGGLSLGGLGQWRILAAWFSLVLFLWRSFE